MLRSKIVSIVDICTRFPWAIIAIAAILTVVTAIYSVHNFSINTNVNQVNLSGPAIGANENLRSTRHFPTAMRRFWRWSRPPPPNWRPRPMPPSCKRLQEQPELFQSVAVAQRERILRAQRAPVLLDRGGAGLRHPVRAGAGPVSGAGHRPEPARPGAGADLRPRRAAAQNVHARRHDAAADDVRDHAGRRRRRTARELLLARTGQPQGADRRATCGGFIEIKPVLDFTALEPGEAATDAIRQAAADLKLESDYRARVRLTGSIPIQDEEFGTLKENWELNTVVSLGFLIGILWLALRLGAHHRGGADQHLRRTGDHRRRRALAGRLAQSDLDRVRRAVRRHRHRLRHPVQRALPRRTLRESTICAWRCRMPRATSAFR